MKTAAMRSFGHGLQVYYSAFHPLWGGKVAE